MGRRDPKHTPEMREAVVRAVAIDGHTAGQVAELAAAGQLAGLPPFEIARSTIRDLVRKAKRAGEIVAAEDESESTKLSREVAMATIARVKALGDKAGSKDLTAVREAARIVRDADRARRPARVLQAPSQPAGDYSLVARMQAEHNADVRVAVKEGPCLHGREASPPYRCWFCRQPNRVPAQHQPH